MKSDSERIRIHHGDSLWCWIGVRHDDRIVSAIISQLIGMSYVQHSGHLDYLHVVKPDLHDFRSIVFSVIKAEISKAFAGRSALQRVIGVQCLTCLPHEVEYRTVGITADRQRKALIAFGREPSFAGSVDGR